jgi:hypothetical protein
VHHQVVLKRTESWPQQEAFSEPLGVDSQISTGCSVLLFSNVLISFDGDFQMVVTVVVYGRD